MQLSYNEFRVGIRVWRFAMCSVAENCYTGISIVGNVFVHTTGSSLKSPVRNSKSSLKYLSIHTPMKKWYKGIIVHARCACVHVIQVGLNPETKCHSYAYHYRHRLKLGLGGTTEFRSGLIYTHAR